MIRAWRCRRLASALVDYSEGSLSPEACLEVEQHLAGCRRCAEAVAALTDARAVAAVPPAVRDESFWVAQRQRIMQAIADAEASPAPVSEPTPLRGFDWRLALPVAAALLIGIAGYLSLRPPAVPGEVALDALPSGDLAELVDVAGVLIPEDELLPDLHVGTTRVVAGAVDAGWVPADDLPGSPAWGELDEKDLDTLNGMLG